MLARWTFLVFLCLTFLPLYAQLDRAKFQQMTSNEWFSFMDVYLTKHWWEFYDATGLPIPPSERLSDYRFMRSVAKGPKNSCLLRLFWCRNQQFADFYCGLHQQETIDTLASIRAYAHQHQLQAEEGICWLVWARAILEQRGSMSVRQRQRLAYTGALQGVARLERLPISVANQYHQATYDIIHHLWWMSMYFFRIEQYELARRIAAVGDQFVHPQLDNKEGHAYGYSFYKWELLNLIGSCYLRSEDRKQAEVWYKKAYAFAKSQNEPLQQDVSYSNIGVALQQQENEAAAAPYVKRAKVLARTATAQQTNAGQLSEDYFQFKWYDKAYQFDRGQFLGLSPEKRFAVMDDYFTKQWRKFYYSVQTATRKSLLVADYHFMQRVAKDPKSATLLRLFWVRNQQYLMVDGGTSHDIALDSLAAIQTYAHQNNLRAEEGICWLARCKLILEHPNKMPHRTRRVMVYEGAVKGLNLLESLPISILHHYNGATFDLTRHLWWLSMYFFQIEEYELLERVARLGYRCTTAQVDAKPEDPLNIEDTRNYVFFKWHFLDDLGSCYLHTGRLTQAETFYRQAYAFAKVNQSSVEAGVSYGNIGVTLSKQKKWAAAVPYLEQAVRVAQQADNRVSCFKAIVPLAEVYLKLKQYDKAFPTLQQALITYNPVDMLVPEVDSLSLIPLLAGLGEVYQRRGDLKQALYYTQLTNRLEEKRIQNNEARIFRQKQKKLEAEAYRANLAQLGADWKQAIWLRNVSILLLLCLLVLSLYYLYYHRKHRRDAEKQLALIVQKARSRTEQLAQFEQQKIDSAQEATNWIHPTIGELTKQAILTEADWERFRKLFERVYPNYLMRLRDAHPTLTPAETRLICLSRLNLSTREMANMLGISADSVIKTRYRIRKKADLPEGTNLTESFGEV